MFYRKGGRYVAKIKVNGKWLHLGGRSTPMEAELLYAQAKKRFGLEDMKENVTNIVS